MILQWIERYGVLQSTHIQLLLGGGRQGIIRRLGKLFEHGYFIKPWAQFGYNDLSGSKPHAYSLERKSYQLLGLECDEELLDWFYSRRWSGLRRTLALITISVLVETAHQPGKIIREVRRRYKRSLKSVVRPTKFVFEIVSERAAVRTVYIASLDFDTNVPIYRKPHSGSSFSKKVERQKQQLENALPNEQYRFLHIVDVPPSRLAHMQECVRKLCGKENSRKFLFASVDNLMKTADLFELECVNAFNEQARI